MKLEEKIVDATNEFIGNFIVPIAKAGTSLVLENEYINPIIKIRSEFAKNKVNLYFDNLHLNSEKEKIDFINSLNDNQKIFFAETVNKIIDLDDSVQNYIMSYLTEEYKNNGELNYFQKKLYYNINSLSEEDFQIFYCLYDKYVTEYKKFKGNIPKIIYYVNSNYINKDIINISLSRFSNLGIIIYKNETKSVERFMDLGQKEKEIELQTNEYYKPTEYSNQLFKKLTPLLKDFDFSKILEVPKRHSLEDWK